MNGQMYQLCSIAAAGKRALKYDESIQYSYEKYENNITFSFLPHEHPKKILKKILKKMKKYTAPSVEAWFEQLKSRGLIDIKFLCPIVVKDRSVLGFSNTTGGYISCFYKDGKVTCFVPDWQYDSEQKLWNIHYSEQEWSNPPSEKPHFDNYTDTFRQVLLEIKDFALKIEFENFAHIFDSARKILDGSEDYPDIKYGLHLPQIPKENLQIFEAASFADVFGAMGSWNDGPSGVAHDKGLDKEYENLSNELLLNIRLAILYAINEW